jgi:hypothetical protein
MIIAHVLLSWCGLSWRNQDPFLHRIDLLKVHRASLPVVSVFAARKRLTVTG